MSWTCDGQFEDVNGSVIVNKAGFRALHLVEQITENKLWQSWKAVFVARHKFSIKPVLRPAPMKWIHIWQGTKPVGDMCKTFNKLFLSLWALMPSWYQRNNLSYYIGLFVCDPVLGIFSTCFCFNFDETCV